MLDGLMRCCFSASIKNLAQRGIVHPVMRSDGDYPGSLFPAIPFILNGDVHSLTDDLKDDPSVRLLGSMNYAFASVDAGREPARRFPQHFQGKGLFGFVAPRLEDLRVIVPMTRKVMPTIGIITARRVAGLLV